MLAPEVKLKISTLALGNPTEETCGFVLADGGVVAVDNVAGDRRRGFEIRPRDFARYEGATAIWHSHPDGSSQFSPMDVRGCKATGMPWIVVHLPTNSFRYADPTGNSPYLGRDWVYGLNDCFGLVTDWLRREMNFDFPDVDRYDDKPEPSRKILEAFPPLMESCGLKRVGDVRYGDVLFMQINSPLPNHCAVMVDPEKNRILHHLIDRYSGTDYYGSYWRKVTDSVWRITD